MTNTKTGSRRKFKAEFKAKVAMEALQERLTLSEVVFQPVCPKSVDFRDAVQS